MEGWIDRRIDRWIDRWIAAWRNDGRQLGGADVHGVPTLRARAGNIGPELSRKPGSQSRPPHGGGSGQPG